MISSVAAQLDLKYNWLNMFSYRLIRRIFELFQAPIFTIFALECILGYLLYILHML